MGFDHRDVFGLHVFVIVGDFQLAGVDALVTGCEAIEIQAHKATGGDHIGARFVGSAGHFEVAGDDCSLSGVLGQAELVGQGVRGFLLVGTVYPQGLIAQASGQSFDSLAVADLEHCQEKNEADG